MQPRWRLIVSLLMGWALLSCKTSPPVGLVSGDEVVVSDVVKGDELVVKKADDLYRVRLLGVFALSGVVADSEIAELAAGAEAFLRNQAVKKKATVVLGDPPIDSNGRYLGYVEIDGNDMGQLLITEGHAVVYTEFPFEREALYLDAEKLARGTGKFLWSGEFISKTVKGLRADWRKPRENSGSPPPADPLLP